MSTEERQRISDTTESFNMGSEEESQQLELLEQKIGSLIEFTRTLKQKKANLDEKLRVTEETFDTLSKQIAGLKAEREKNTNRIATLLKKIDQAVPDIN